jgi:NAD(P)-dependent dehydrogenase (short-subunit alcohol dehydrogenase family)
MKVEGKIIVVTGAGSGIGRELALLLLTKGARVAGVDLNAAALSETARLADGRRNGFEPLVANIADRAAVEQLPQLVCTKYGAVDGVINNAGIIQPFVKINALDYATIERVLNVNLLGTLYVTKTFLPYLLKRPEAHIVNLSSMGGFVPVPGQTIYCAAKAGVKLLSEGLASELIDTNIRVTVVFPGAIATNITTNSGVTAPSTGAQHSGPIKPLPARTAAERIVEAMERNALHVFVGRDSAVMNLLHRLHPTFAARTIANRMKALISD